MTVPTTNPAPVTPPAAPVPPQPQAPTQSATQTAGDAVRAALASGKTLAEALRPEQPRTDGGQFAPITPEPVPQATPAATSPAEGTEPQEGVEGQPAGDKAADGQPEAPAGEPEAPAEYRVALPGRNENEEFEIVVDSPEAEERLKQLVNGYSRGEALKAQRAEIEQTRSQIEQEYHQLAAIQDTLTTDPEGFVTDNLPVESQRNLALYLLTQPEVWGAVQDIVLQLDDPQTLQLVQNKVKADRYETREARRQQVETRARASENARQIRQAVSAIVPEDMEEAQSRLYYRDALRDLQEYAVANNLDAMNPADVPLVIADRLRQYGINPAVAQERLAALVANGGRQQPQGRRSTEPGSGTPKPAAGSGAASQAPATPAKTGKEFVARSGARRVVAAVTPPGGGSPSNVPTPPPNQSIAERTEWARKNLKFGSVGR